MNGLRVALVTRRFWPLTGMSESRVADFAEELLLQGHSPSIVTARFDAQWPQEVTFRGVLVHRLPFPQRFGWGMMRYLIGLSRWLRRNLVDVDILYVTQLSREAHTAIRAVAGRNVPVVIGIDPDETSDESLSGAGSLQSRLLRRCQAAAAIVTSASVVREKLLQHDYLEQQVHVVPEGVRIRRLPTQADRLAARAALAGANEDLRVALHAPVVVTLAPLEPGFGLKTLVDAWQLVSRELPFARLWMIGDGRQRDRLYRRVQDADLVGRVLLPGCFDDLDEILQAANLLVIPASEIDQSSSMLRGMAAGLPVLAARRPEHDHLICPPSRGQSFAPSDSNALATAITSALAEPGRNQQMAQSAQAFVQQYHSLCQTTQQQLHLFRSLLESSKRSTP